MPSITSWRAEIDGKRFSYIPVVERKLFKNNNLKASVSARGDLNPVSGFYFPLFSTVFPWEISIRVESGGFSRKKKWRFVAASTYKFFICIGRCLPFHGDIKNPSLMRF